MVLMPIDWQKKEGEIIKKKKEEEEKKFGKKALMPIDGQKRTER